MKNRMMNICPKCKEKLDPAHKCTFFMNDGTTISEIDKAQPIKETFERELEDLINKYSMENDSATPDFLLVEYLKSCLDTFGRIARKRDKYYAINT